MSEFKPLLSEYIRQQMTLQQKYSWKHYCWDFLLAFLCTLAITLAIYGLKLYPEIPNISLIYLPLILLLGSTRGMAAAIFASVIAFFSFDYFLVHPVYTFSIEGQEEWLALVIFLFAAIITSQLAAALHLRTEQARQREQETRVLFELLRDAHNEEDLDRQLGSIARKVVEVFGGRGVQDCLILLPNEQGQPVLRASAGTSRASWQMTPDELTTVAWVMREGQTVDFYALAHRELRPRTYSPLLVIRSTAMQSTRQYLSMIPLKAGQQICGVLCLLMEEDPSRFSKEKRLGSEADRNNPRSTFFWAFVDQTASMLEHARLRSEGLQVEVLKRTDTLRAALISSVSHDLRTPLTSIKAAASSLLQDDVPWSDEERHSFAQAIEHEADRLNRLVENLLDMSRIEAGALKPEKEWYPVDELLHDVLDRMQPLVRGREVTLYMPEDLPPVELDYMMIDQAVTNLLENALRYTPPGSPIEISAEVSGENLCISLADRGPGIPPSDLERVFDKFYRVMDRRTRSPGASGGTGVGLSVCRGLIEAHGGRIWAANRPGGGVVLRFTLPLHLAREKQQETEESLI